MEEETLDDLFDYHPPGVETAKRVTAVRMQCKHLAKIFEETLPPRRESTLALQKVEEAMFWANAALARENA